MEAAHSFLEAVFTMIFYRYKIHDLSSGLKLRALSSHILEAETFCPGHLGFPWGSDNDEEAGER